MNFGVNSKLMLHDAASLHAVLPLLLSPPPLSSFGTEHNFYNSLLFTFNKKWGLGREKASLG